MPIGPVPMIIVAKALYYQIADRYWRIQGLPLSDDDTMVLDTTYFDDTKTYVKGDANNLVDCKVQLISSRGNPMLK